MDRSIFYAGALPRSSDVLFGQRAAMTALALLTKTVMGSTTTVDGLTVGPNSPAALSVVVAPGAIYSPASLDASDYGALPQDTTHSIMKQGIALDATVLTITPPAGSGNSQVYLVQAQFQEVDASPVTLPYYNAANPSVPFSGPANSGTPQNTRRLGTVVIQTKAGAIATTGSEVAPSPDAGWVGLAAVTVANGATTITSGNIVANASLRRPVAALPDLATLLANGTVGATRNLRASQTTAGASLTITADEVAVKSALGGTSFLLPSFSKTVNLGGTGAGGMDTGSAPASSWVAIYAIYNPSTGTSALLAQSGAAARAEVYGGANMPTGYTHSALLAVWPTNGSGNMIAGLQLGRRLSIAQVSVLSSSAVGGPTSLSLATIVPPNAKRVRGYGGFQSTDSTSAVSLAIGATSALFDVNSGSDLGQGSMTFDVQMVTAQQVHWQSGNSAGTYGANVFVTGYEI